MKLEEMTNEQIQAALKAGTPEDIKAYLENEGIELPAKAPWKLPDEILKFGMKLWQTVMIKKRIVCAEEEHDFQRTGNSEMERHSGTGAGSSFRHEYQCTKCGMIKWESDVKPAETTDSSASADTAADDRAARRAARKAARAAAAS